VVQIQHHLPDVFGRQPSQYSFDQRPAAERHRGFRDEPRQRIEPGAQTGSEYQGRKRQANAF
jgi:hypothetical protein